MDIAADDDRVRRPGRGDLLQQARSRGRIAVPVLRPVRDRAIRQTLLELGHQLSLRKNVPARRRASELAIEPGFLRLAEIGPARVEALRTVGIDQLLGTT